MTWQQNMKLMFIFCFFLDLYVLKPRENKNLLGTPVKHDL